MRIGLIVCITFIFLLVSGAPVFASGEVDGSFTAGDYYPPSAVTDLFAAANTSYSISLYWTAPGDDGIVGTATAYDIRYSVSPITSENRWNAANSVFGAPVPLSAGSRQYITVGGLLPSTTYYFALKSVDDESNWSLMSNCASAVTPALTPITPVATTTPPTTSTTTPATPDDSPVYINIKGKRGVIFLELWGDGTLARTYYVTLYEYRLEMALFKGTILLDKWGKPVSVIVLEYVDPYGTPPQGYEFLATYDFQPACVIDPAIHIKMNYGHEIFATTFDESDIHIAHYNALEERWIMMDSARDAAAQCAGTELTHFSLFALLVPSSGTGGGSSNITPMHDLVIRNLTLSSNAVEEGDVVTVSADLANQSNTDGVFYIKLVYDGATVDGKTVSIQAMEEIKEQFTLILEESGVHTIGVNSMLTTVTVYQPVPPPVGLWAELRTPLICITAIGLAVIVIFILIARIRKSSSFHRHI
ncbi:MAG: hypothetical protein JXA17_04320 [Dehalococcoidales bacterium]|nr:hypothetical protein [Dehalococcoidales bacterium]